MSEIAVIYWTGYSVVYQEMRRTFGSRKLAEDMKNGKDLLYRNLAKEKAREMDRGYSLIILYRTTATAESELEASASQTSLFFCRLGIATMRL